MAGGWGVQIELVRDAGALAALEPAWKDLFARSRASPYWSFEWFSTAWKHFGREGRLRTCVVRCDGRVVAIVPLELRDEKVGPVWRRVLRCAQGGWATRDEALLDREAPDVFESVLEYLARHSRGWDYCVLAGLLPDSALMRQVCQVRTTSAVVGPYFERRHAVIIRLPGSWEQFRHTLGKSTRRALQYRTNMLAREGSLKLERFGLDPQDARDTNRLEMLLADALTVHRHSWQAEAATGTAIGDPEVAPFFEEASRRVAEVGLLDLSVLYAGTRPVSFSWGLAREGRIWGSKIGFDKRLARCSPGSVHMAKVIADSIERGLSEVDWGDEFLDSKVRWTRQLRPVYDAYIHASHPIARLIRWWRLRGRRGALRDSVSAQVESSSG